MGHLPRSALLLVFLSLLGANVSADPAKEQRQARRSFDRAEAHFKAGLFAEALAEYQEGYQQLPLPGFLVNIAQCQRRLGDLEQARATYRKFLLVAPDSPYLSEVQSLVAELDKLLDTTPPSAPVPSTPGEERAAAPAPPTSPAPAPRSPEHASAVAAQNLVTAPADNPAPPAAGKRRWWLWGAIGGAVAVGTVTAILLLQSPETTTVHDGSIGTLRR
jgi:tetratricopeptide (TPR) repeat protein